MRFFVKINTLFFVFSAIMFLIGGGFATYAQNRIQFSSTEDVAIAFYKTGDVVPNFKRWITERKPYNLTPWAKRKEMLQKETLRLNTAYRQFNPEKDFLLIRTFVQLNPTFSTSSEGKKSYTLPIRFTNAPEALYFPYDFLGERIVVMPHKLDQFMNSVINKNQYDFISKAVKGSAENTMIVRLKAVESDTSQPHKIDGLDQWVLKTSIVSLEVWSKQGALLWEYTAPWYTSPSAQKIKKLYDGRPTSSPERGSVKSLFQEY